MLRAGSTQLPWAARQFWRKPAQADTEAAREGGSGQPSLKSGCRSKGGSCLLTKQGAGREGGRAEMGGAQIPHEGCVVSPCGALVLELREAHGT